MHNSKYSKNKSLLTPREQKVYYEELYIIAVIFTHKNHLKKIEKKFAIRGSQSLEQFAKIIIKSFGMEFEHQYGFLDTNDLKRAQESYLFAQEILTTKEPFPDEIIIAQFFENINEKKFMIYNFYKPWYFSLLCEKIDKTQKAIRYPIVVENVEEKINMRLLPKFQNDSKDFYGDFEDYQLFNQLCSERQLINNSSERKTTKEDLLQLKITLSKEPPIYRKIILSANITFEDFHYILQIVMGWENSHMYSFNSKRLTITGTSIFDTMEDEKIQSSNVFLYEFFSTKRKKITYVYDFGDNWEHEVKLEKVINSSNCKGAILECIEGEGPCPPEDCGGMWGYLEIIDIINDPRHSQFEEYNEYYAEEIESSFFDIKEINKKLVKMGKEL